MRNYATNGSRTLSLWLASVAAAALVEIAPAGAAEPIYSFVDEQGVVHLSNVPLDPRYQIAAAQPETALTAPQRSTEPDATSEPALEPEPVAPPPGERFTPITITPTPPER